MTIDPDSDYALTCRRALEALRNGVPNREAVAILGCNQPEAERRFEQMLTLAAEGTDRPGGNPGMLVSGDFGSGKSHLLTHLEHEALSRGFICSTVAISKETPLYDLAKVFKSAVENGRMPDRSGRMIEELGQALDPRSAAYSNFVAWANDTQANGLNQVFPASLLVHERSRDLELNSEIEYYWGGDRIMLSRVKDGLRQIGQLGNYSFRAPRLAELAAQRLAFITGLVRAAGYRGWIVLLDEIELVGSYSLLQRGRSYSELARWLGRSPGKSHPGLAVVGTVTEDFALEIISPDGTRRDRDYVVPRLAVPRLVARYGDLSEDAETGMQVLERDCLPLNAPSDTDVQEMVEKLRETYSVAYSWDAPAIDRRAGGAGYQNRMRYKVRASINEWDLLRLYPGYRPETEGDEFRHSYEPDADMERESSDGPEPAQGSSAPV